MHGELALSGKNRIRLVTLITEIVRLFMVPCVITVCVRKHVSLQKLKQITWVLKLITLMVISCSIAQRKLVTLSAELSFVCLGLFSQTEADH